MSDTKKSLALALVLCDVAAHGLKAGALLQASPDLIKTLQANGEVDPHRSAVAYAKEQGLQPVRSRIEEAAEERAAFVSQLTAEIAKGEAALKDATDDAVKAALQADIDANKAKLADLQA